MRVLIVANHNTGEFSPFVEEQVNELRQLGVEFDFYGVHGKGVWGYLLNLGSLKQKIREYKPDLIHAHYGLSGLLANLQRKVPVVTTYHGSDIHAGGKALLFSRLTIHLSKFNIFVSSALLKQSGYRGKNMSVIPCGVDTKVFQPIDKQTALAKLGWDKHSKYILFSGSFDREIKNPKLALASINELKKSYIKYRDNIKLIELKGFTRTEVAMLLNAADCMLLTSYREGSPQIVKEAMACGCPIVSVKAGDVEITTQGVEGCIITSPTPESLASAMNQIFERNLRTTGRKRILELSLTGGQIAKKVKEVYNTIKKQA